MDIVNNIEIPDNYRLLLWHGTKPENILSILTNGFKISPITAQYTASAYGSGVYMTDVYAKAMSYST